MSHIRDAEQALALAKEKLTNKSIGGYSFCVSETDRTVITSVKEAQDHLDRLLLIQRIEKLKAEVVTAEAERALQDVAEKVAHFAMEA